MDIYKLSRHFWDNAFSNPEKIKPNHCAIYFFAVEHCNRLGWKEKFGFPTSMVMEATGIKSYSVFKKTFDDLVSFGMFDVIEYSKNQYSANIIALKENNKARNKALDKASVKHVIKQSESTRQSIGSIDKQETINYEPLTNKQGFDFSKSSEEFKKYFLEEFISAPKQKKKSKELQNKILVDLQSYDEPFAIDLMKKAVLNNWQGYKFDKTDEQYADYLRKKQNPNSSQWANGNAGTLPRPAGKQPHVFSGAEFSAKVQERLEDQGLFD